MEDDQKQKWKTTSRNKMEDEPINQYQDLMRNIKMKSVIKYTLEQLFHLDNCI